MTLSSKQRGLEKEPATILTPEQQEKVSLLSDTTMYTEAVIFIQRLMDKQVVPLPKTLTFLEPLLGEVECEPLATSQVTGLLSITHASKYSELLKFINHQRDRNWTGSRVSIKTFYTALGKYFEEVKRKRVKEEFHLRREGLTTKEATREMDELMAKLAHEFIQHLVAENGLLALKKAKERANRR